MQNAKFLQLHTLTSYPATLLNRDDAGFAKRLPFGGATRTRVSSQCLKYHWRHNNGEHALYNMEVPRTFRSRQTLIRKLAYPLIESGLPAPLVRAATLTIKELLLSGKSPGKNDIKNILKLPDAEGDELLATNQITVFGEPEINYLRNIAVSMIEDMMPELSTQEFGDSLTYSSDDFEIVHKHISSISKGDLKKSLTSLKQASGLDAAMFGRMVTSDILSRGDAAIHVAHSITTHAQSSESDYFAAIDELTAEDGTLGSGHINSTELTSGLFYSYVVIDIPLLVSNLEGCAREEWLDADRDLASRVIERFIHLMATASPGAKLGSTAPYSYADMVFAELGNAQPRTLANAFRRPVDQHPDVLENSYQALGKYVTSLDQMYGHDNMRNLAAHGADVDGLCDALGVQKTTSVKSVAEWAANQVRG